MSMPLASDYLFLQPLIEQRLRDQIAGLPVEGIEQLAQAVDSQDQRPRVCYVLWSGDRFPEAAPRGSASVVVQQWTAWLRVRNASAADKDARNEAAGAVLSALHKALSGWAPPDQQRAFRRASGARPNYQATSGLYPLTFEIELYL
jgi:hypothetical protein